MALKIEIIQSKKGNPPFIIINDKEIYPILDISFQGETEEDNPNFERPFSLKKGTVFFVDIFKQPHYFVNFEKEKEENPILIKHSPISERDIQWEKRLKAQDKYAEENKKEPEKNPLKRLPPWFWETVPEKDWPEWMKNEI